MKDFEVEVLAASSHDEDTILTLRVQYPRIVLSELNTHRWLSKNSGSSRAIPTSKMLDMVMNEPAMPVRFGGNKSGMQDTGEEHTNKIVVPTHLHKCFLNWALDNDKVAFWYSDGTTTTDARTFWQFMAVVNALASKAYSAAGYHKQIANRLTEPYQWMNTVVSATTQGWVDFLALRDHEAADPTIAKLALMTREVRNNVTYTPLQPGQWHLPYILEAEKDLPIKKKLILSTARLARVSYEPFDGNPSHEKEQSRHDLLVNSEPPHMSPTEHPCTPMEGRWGNFVGFKQYRQFLERGEEI